MSDAPLRRSPRWTQLRLALVGVSLVLLGLSGVSTGWTQAPANAEPGTDNASATEAAPADEASAERPTADNPASGETATTEASADQAAATTAETAAAESEPTEEAVAKGEVRAQPEVLEDIVDQALRVAELPASGNTPTHFTVAAGFLLLALIFRFLLVKWIFRGLKRVVDRTPFEFDNYLLPPLEATARTLILLMGVVGALMVLKLPPAVESALEVGYVIAFSLVALVFFLRLADAILDDLQRKARKRQLNVVAFMPWIKRVVLALILVIGVLMIAQSLGANVRAFLAGLGIGGLAVALAAQDTLANIFGSVVIALDQPFRLGEFVQIGANAGAVEDIGLRSTRLRTAQKNLITIPNKTVAAEPIINLTRFLQRRVEQNIGLTYASTPEQMEAIVEDIRAIILAEPEVDKSSVMVQFNDFKDSSLNVWLVYATTGPDFLKHLKLRQRINLAIMRAVATRGLQFAFPSQSLYVESWPNGGVEAPSRPDRPENEGNARNAGELT